MCQYCVDEGTITQQEYDAARAAGDTSRMPLNELPRAEAEKAMGDLIREALDAPWMSDQEALVVLYISERTW